MGINLTATSARTPESNVVAERVNRTLSESVRSMLKESKMPNAYRRAAMNYARHSYNRTISKVIGVRTLHEMFFGEPPQNDKVRIFRCTAVAHVHKGTCNSTLSHHAEIGVFSVFIIVFIEYI